MWPVHTSVTRRFQTWNMLLFWESKRTLELPYVIGREKNTVCSCKSRWLDLFSVLGSTVVCRTCSYLSISRFKRGGETLEIYLFRISWVFTEGEFHWWYDGMEGHTNLDGSPPPQKKNTDGLKHHPVGVSGMRPFMDGIIENKVGNSLDSSLETQNHQPGSHRDWDLETSILISDSRIDYLSYHSLTFSAWHVQHVFNQSNFPLIKVSFSFSFLTSHPNPNDVSLGTPVTWNRTNVAFQAIGRNEFAFYFRSLGLENRFSRDSNRMVQAAINPATKNGEMWQCLEIFGKKKTTTEKTRFF